MSEFAINNYLTEIDLEDIIKDSDKIKDIKINFFSKIIECINVFNQEIISKLNEIKVDSLKFKKFCKSFKDDKNMLNLLGNHQEGSDGLIKYFTKYLERDDVNAIMVDKYYKDQGSKEKFINKVKEYAQEMYNENYKKLISKIDEECLKVANEEIKPDPAPDPEPDPAPEPKPDPDPAPQPLVTPSPNQLGKITATVKEENKVINEENGYYTVNPSKKIIIELKSSKEEDFSPSYQINGSDKTNISNNKIILTSSSIMQYSVEHSEFTIHISANNHDSLEIKIKIKQSDPESFSIEVKEGGNIIQSDTDDRYQLENNNDVEIIVSGLDKHIPFTYKIHNKEEVYKAAEPSINSTQKIQIPKVQITGIELKGLKEFNVEIKQSIRDANGGVETKNEKIITIIKKQTDEPSPDPPPDPSEKIELGAPPDTQYDQIGVADLPESINSTDKILESNKILAILQVSGEKDSGKFVDYYFVHSNKIIKNKDKSEHEIQIMDNSVELIDGKYCIKFYINNITNFFKNKDDTISVTSIFFNKKLDNIKTILSKSKNKIYLIEDENDNIDNGIISFNKIMQFQHNNDYSKYVNLEGVELATIE